MAGRFAGAATSLEQPDLRVIVVDQKTEFDVWAGEFGRSRCLTTMRWTCRLGPYLAAEHIVKHGLRFWFDSPGKDLRMSELSEQGRSRYTTLNRGVQLDCLV